MIGRSLFFGTGASGFNGGKMQVNVGQSGDVAIASEYPFLNLLKGAVIWSWSDSSNSPVDPSILDSNGYPTSIAHTGLRLQSIYAPLPSQITGNPSTTSQNYVLKWTGDGTCGIGGINTTITYQITAATATNPCVLTCAAGTGNNTFNLRVGQPITVSGITNGTGAGWTGLNATWQITNVDTTNRTITVGFNASAATGTVGTSGTSLVTNILTTTTSTGLAGQGRYVFSSQTGGDVNTFTFSITAVNSSSNYPHAAILCHEDDESLIDNGYVFGAKFKQKIIDGGFGVIRFENWQHTDATCNVTTWATQRPVGYVYYAGTEFRANINCGTTSNVGNAYTASAPAIDSATGAAWTNVLHDKTTVQVIFNVSATASGTCSLAVGSTPAKNILNQYSNALSSLPSSYPVGGTFQSLATLVYDITLDAWIKQGGDSSLNSRGIANGVPSELCLRLCTECGMHPYFNTPMYTCTIGSVTDYMPTLIAYCKANAPSWMIPRFEGTNEIFNQFSGFLETYYAYNTQSVINGSTVPGGVLTTVSYNVSAATAGASTTNITLSTTGNSFIVGSNVLVASFGGFTGWNNRTGFVTAINVGGDPNTITIDIIPTGGSYTSGGTVTPVTSDWSSWYGRMLSYVGQAAANVYGSANLGSTYHVLCGVQTGTAISFSTGTNTTTNSDQRLESRSFILANNPASPYVAQAAKLLASAIACTQYFTSVGGTYESTLSGLFDAKRFIGSCVNGVITTTAVSVAGTAGTGPLIGDTIFGINIGTSQGVTVTGKSGTSPNLTLTLSDLTINFPTNTYYAGTDMNQPQYAIDGCVGAYFTATISGTTLTIVALGSNSQPISTQMLLSYSGSPDNLCITSGSGSTWTLSAAPGNQPVAIQMYGSPSDRLPALNNLYKNWYNWAQSKINTNGAGLIMMGYEGGFSADYSGGGATALDIFRYAQKFVTSSPNSANGLQGYYTTNLNNFTTQHGTFPSEYQFTGRYPTVGVWQVLETIYQTPDPPQWLAIKAFNAH